MYNSIKHSIYTVYNIIIISLSLSLWTSVTFIVGHEKIIEVVYIPATISTYHLKPVVSWMVHKNRGSSMSADREIVHHDSIHTHPARHQQSLYNNFQIYNSCTIFCMYSPGCFIIICCPSLENDRLANNLIHKKLSLVEAHFMSPSLLKVSAFSDLGLRVVNADRNPV